MDAFDRAMKDWLPLIGAVPLFFVLGLLAWVRIDDLRRLKKRQDADVAFNGESKLTRCRHGVWLGDHCFQCAKGTSVQEEVSE